MAEGGGGGRGGRRLQGLLPGHRVQQRASWSRSTWRGSGGTILRRERLSHCFAWNLDILSTRPLLRHFAHVSCDRLQRLSEEFLEDFHVKVDTDPEVDSPVALGKLELFLRAPCILPPMRQMEACGRISRIFSLTVNSNPAVAAGGVRSSSHS